MAEFGTPETWNMKVGDFIESELPKEKPQALLDLQEQNRKQRLLDTLQKIGPFLMDESLDFIERENFASGSKFEPNISIFEDIVLNCVFRPGFCKTICRPLSPLRQINI